jgi:ATP-dependent DNA ligase
VPSARGFVHELKLDGYRLQAHLHDGHVTLYTRSGFDWTNRFPTIATDVAPPRQSRAQRRGHLGRREWTP